MTEQTHAEATLEALYEYISRQERNAIREATDFRFPENSQAYDGMVYGRIMGRRYLAEELRLMMDKMSEEDTE